MPREPVYAHFGDDSVDLALHIQIPLHAVGAAWIGIDIGCPQVLHLKQGKAPDREMNPPEGTVVTPCTKKRRRACQMACRKAKEGQRIENSESRTDGTLAAL